MSSLASIQRSPIFTQFQAPPGQVSAMQPQSGLVIAAPSIDTAFQPDSVLPYRTALQLVTQRSVRAVNLVEDENPLSDFYRGEMTLANGNRVNTVVAKNALEEFLSAVRNDPMLNYGFKPYQKPFSKVLSGFFKDIMGETLAPLVIFGITAAASAFILTRFITPRKALQPLVEALRETRVDMGAVKHQLADLREHYTPVVWDKITRMTDLRLNKRFLDLFGPYGTGKTYVMDALMKELDHIHQGRAAFINYEAKKEILDILDGLVSGNRLLEERMGKAIRQVYGHDIDVLYVHVNEMEKFPELEGIIRKGIGKSYQSEGVPEIRFLVTTNKLNTEVYRGAIERRIGGITEGVAFVDFPTPERLATIVTDAVAKKLPGLEKDGANYGVFRATLAEFLAENPGYNPDSIMQFTLGKLKVLGHDANTQARLLESYRSEFAKRALLEDELAGLVRSRLEANLQASWNAIHPEDLTNWHWKLMERVSEDVKGLGRNGWNAAEWRERLDEAIQYLMKTGYKDVTKQVQHTGEQGAVETVSVTVRKTGISPAQDDMSDFLKALQAHLVNAIRFQEPPGVITDMRALAQKKLAPYLKAAASKAPTLEAKDKLERGAEALASELPSPAVKEILKEVVEKLQRERKQPDDVQWAHVIEAGLSARYSKENWPQGLDRDLADSMRQAILAAIA